MGLTVLFTWLAVLGLAGGRNPQHMVTTGFAALLGVLTINDLRSGVRPPNPWERFRAWMSLRPVLIGTAGIALFLTLPPDLGSALGFLRTRPPPGSSLSGYWCGSSHWPTRCGALRIASKPTRPTAGGSSTGNKTRLELSAKRGIIHAGWAYSGERLVISSSQRVAYLL